MDWSRYTVSFDNLYKPEIIIVDNFSTDETINIVRQFLQDLI